MSLFAYTLSPGPNWIPGKPVTEQPLQDHINYMLQLYARNLVAIAGPLMDNTGGLFVINVESPQDAQAIISNDPAIKSGICVCETGAHPWFPLLNRYTGENHVAQQV